jgi:hypothetical protein
MEDSTSPTTNTSPIGWPTPAVPRRSCRWWRTRAIATAAGSPSTPTSSSASRPRPPSPSSPRCSWTTSSSRWGTGVEDPPGPHPGRGPLHRRPGPPHADLRDLRHHRAEVRARRASRSRIGHTEIAMGQRSGDCGSRADSRTPPRQWFVSLTSSSSRCWALGGQVMAPAMTPQQFPHPARGAVDRPGHLGDHPADRGQRPRSADEPTGRRALLCHRGDLGELLLGQQRATARMTRRAQGTTPPSRQEACHTLAVCADTLVEPLGGPQPQRLTPTTFLPRQLDLVPTA